jgi:hypothetical protein
MRWQRLLIVLPTMMLLTACDLETSDIVVKIICPTIRHYDQATLDRSLAEYQALPKGSAIREMIGDYKALRNQINACRATSLPLK